MSAVTKWTTAAAVAATIALAGPAGAQVEKPTYVLRGAEVHTMAGTVIPNGTVIIRDGRIEAVGTDVETPAGATVVDLAGKRVYPGFFDAMTNLGLTEIGAVDVTNDDREMGDFNPHLHAEEAIHPASEHIPVARSNGVTTAVSAPGGGTIAGQAVLLDLDGWTVEEMARMPSIAMVVNWPSIQTREFDRENFEWVERDWDEAMEEYEAELTELREWFEAAKHQVRVMEARPDAVGRDLKLEAVARILDGELPVIIQADEARDIRNAVEFAEAEGLDFVIAGAREGWKVKDFLVEHRVRLIIGGAQSTPDRDDRYDQAYRNAAELHQAGVPFAMSTFSSADVRTLPYEIGTAVGFGLPREAALEAVTVMPARILGVEHLYGTIEPGKVANLQVVDGDPFEFTTTTEHVFIDGVEVDLMDKHRRLYERYRSRPGG